MSKKIPKVFANDINTDGNNKNVFYSKSNESVEAKEEKIVFDDNSNKNVGQKINDIFNSSSYVYKADVVIKLKDEVVTKRIVGKNRTHLITMENELIPISDIVDIKRK